MSTFLQDLKFGLRMLAKNPGFTTVAVLTLALGIGANTAIFTVVDNVLLRPLPYPHAEQIVRVGSIYQGAPYSGTVIAGPHYRFLEKYSRSFESVEAHDVVTSGANVSGGAVPEHLVSATVSAGLWRVLGVVPALGRYFTEEEDRPDGPCAVILTDSLWHRRYAGDPTIVGRNIALNEQSCLVTAILPRGFSFDQSPDIFMSARIPPVTRDLGHYYFMLARLRPDVSIGQARTEMVTLFARFKNAYGDLVDSQETGFGLKPYLDSMIGEVRPSLWTLFGAVGIVLLIACANIANLLLSHGGGRAREMAVRAALGAARRRLLRQLVTESALLAFAGGGLGLLIAKLAISALHLLASNSLPRASDISLDLRVVGFAFFLSIVTVLLFGLAPALYVTSMDINGRLQAASGRASAGVNAARTSRWLIGAEVALSIVLLAGAGLLIRSFVELRSVAPGFDPTGVLTFNLSPLPRYSTTPLLWEFERRVLERIRALPGVESAAVSICLPFEPGPLMPAEILGQSPPTPLNPHYRTISPDYFRSLKIPIVRGRSFSESDTSNSTPTVIINQSMARRFFKDRDPLGEHLRLGVGLGAAYAESPRVIVGVVGDVRESSLDQPAGWTVFIPRAQVPSSLTADINRLAGTSWVVKTKLPPAQLVEDVRRTIVTIDPLQPIFNIRTMEQIMSNTVDRQRLTLILMTIFAALGMLLAAVGIYGVISYIVARRTHEVGIRMALGATRNDVLLMVLSEGLKLALMGVAIGLVAVFGVTRLMANMLFGVSPHDPLTLAGAASLLILVAAAACYIPARRAARVDPMVALRYE